MLPALGQRASFQESWRRQKSRAFDLYANSTARRAITFPLWGRSITAYANANLSIYSAQRCNARCPFCVEELRPASRGKSLRAQKQIERDDARYFRRLEETLDALRPLAPTLSITGGEPSKDPRLPRILECVAKMPAKRKTLTTNGSGFLDVSGARRVIDDVVDARLNHVNVSVAHPDRATNAALMRLHAALTPDQLKSVVTTLAQAGTRVRLSCVLLKAAVHSLEDILAYLDFARSLGVDNVIFRQLMKSDPATHAPNSVVAFSEQERVLLEPLLGEISDHPQFEFVKQVMGYYYYVEIYHYQGMDVVFEEADLAQLEATKRRQPHVIHELVFHPSALLAYTWQPWDGILGPPPR
jgi:MoaA/NifB/PqqE/SkfB family radical SAM enzyme